MIRLLVSLLLLLSSCSTENGIFVQKNDYIIQNREKYIRARISNKENVINNLSENKFVIRNNEVDTIFIFSTVLENENMFYSGKNVQQKKDGMIVDTYYSEYMADALHSGIKKFNFIQLLPNDSLTINIDINRLVKEPRNYPFSKLRLLFYYYRKQGQSFDGLVNISKRKLVKKYSTSLNSGARMF